MILILVDSEWPDLSNFMSSSDHKCWKASWVPGMAFIKGAHRHRKPHCCHQQRSAAGIPLSRVDVFSVCMYVEIFSFIYIFMIGLPTLLKDHLVESGIRVIRWGIYMYIITSTYISTCRYNFICIFDIRILRTLSEEKEMRLRIRRSQNFRKVRVSDLKPQQVKFFMFLCPLWHIATLLRKVQWCVQTFNDTYKRSSVVMLFIQTTPTHTHTITPSFSPFQQRLALHCTEGNY